MSTEELRVLSVEELRAKILDARQEMMNLRFQVVTGQLTDTSRLKTTRRLVARLETLIHEREREEEGKE